MMYALALFAHSGIEILSRGFYALADTRTPVTFAVLSMAINLVLCLLLVQAFEVNGLAIALSIAAIIEFGLLARALAIRMGGLDNARLARSVTQTVAATILMAQLVALWLLVLRAAGALDSSDRLTSAFALAGALGIGSASFYLTSRLLGSSEARLLTERMPLPASLRRLAGLQGSP
jgi:putative peptidoglycan lipid II flippase